MWAAHAASSSFLTCLEKSGLLILEATFPACATDIAESVPDLQILLELLSAIPCIHLIEPATSPQAGSLVPVILE